MTDALALLPCAERAEALGEDMAGSAPVERAFLVIEQPGPWGRDAVAESGLRPVAAELNAHAKASGVRIQVIRNSTSRYRAEHPQSWLVGVAAGKRFVERLHRDPPDLLELPLGPEPTGTGELEDGPLVLCCTHSTRDPCCARRGLPLHRALCDAGARTWHSSHLGGHRFAATMAYLPLGVWLGRVPAGEAADVLALLREDRLPLPYLRGRAGEPPDVQAAEIAVRRHAGLDHVDDLAVSGREGDRIAFTARDGRIYRTAVRNVPTERVRAVSCGADAKQEDPGRYEVTLEPQP